MPQRINNWIYIYKVSGDNDCIIYDRTVARNGLGPERAIQRVAELKTMGIEAFYTIGVIIPGALS